MFSSVWKEHLRVPPLSCWANGSASQHCSHAGFTSPRPHATHRLAITICPCNSYRQHFIYLHAQTPAVILDECQVRRHWQHPPSSRKTRSGHNWPVQQVSCWKSRLCTDVKLVVFSNHVHTHSGFNSTLDRNTQGWGGFDFKDFFWGKLAWRLVLTAHERSFWFELFHSQVVDCSLKEH